MKTKRPVVRFPAYWRAYYWMMTPDQKKAARDSLQKELDCLQMQLEVLRDLIAEDESLEVISGE